MSQDKKIIPFLNVYLKCKEVIEGKITNDEFNKFLYEEIEIEQYLPIQIKKSLIDIFFVRNNMEIQDFSDMSFAFEVYSILGLLLMYTNIDVSAEEMIAENYDIVIQSGLAEYVVDECREDYNRLYNMGINAIIFKNSFVIDSLSHLTPDNLTNAIDNTRNLIDGMSEDKLRIMKDVLEFNDPHITEIKESIYSGADLFVKNKELQDLKEG